MKREKWRWKIWCGEKYDVGKIWSGEKLKSRKNYNMMLGKSKVGKIDEVGKLWSEKYYELG